MLAKGSGTHRNAEGWNSSLARPRAHRYELARPGELDDERGRGLEVGEQAARGRAVCAAAVLEHLPEEHHTGLGADRQQRRRAAICARITEPCQNSVIGR